MSNLFTYAHKAKELSISTYDVCSNIRDESDDFEVENYRFISKHSIDEIMRDELGSDEYMLGCFNAWFLADILGTSTEAIEAMQEKEAFEGIGKMILSNDKLHDLQQEYVSADGYGHHFNHYDGNEDETGEYYIFRTN